MGYADLRKGSQRYPPTLGKGDFVMFWIKMANENNFEGKKGMEEIQA